MENLLETLMEKKAVLNSLKEEVACLEEQIYDGVKSHLSSEKSSTTIRFNNGLKLTVKRNLKYKLSGQPPEGIDIYKQTVDEAKLKKYDGEEWVLSYENKPSLTLVREV